MAIIGLDVGSSGCKCLLFGEDGRLIASSRQEYAPEHPAEGYWEMNPNTVWEAVKLVIRQATSLSDGESVRALAISSFGEAAVPIGSHGQILHNSLLYSDKRGRDENEELKRKLGSRIIMSHTGVTAHPMYTINKMMWLQRNKPDIYRQTEKFLLFGDFIAYRLTGEMKIDYSLASRTMAFNLLMRDWDPLLCDAAGIDPRLFARPIQSGHVIGTILKPLQQELGLSGETLVVAGGHDQACAALGAGILQQGMAIDGMGTVECIAPAYTSPVLTDGMAASHFTCTPHVVEGLYLSYAFNFSGGSLLKWYAQHGVNDSLLATITSDTLERLEFVAPASPTELLVLPHFAGSGTPSMNPLSKGAILGLTFDTTPGHIYRALMEGMCFEMRYNLDKLKQVGIKVDSLRAVGGGAKSALWLQIKADVLGLPVETLSFEEAGAVGTAMLAGTAAGVYADLATAASALVHTKHNYLPNTRHKDVYEQQYEKYQKLYPALMSLINKGGDVLG